jgi:hypothetical protein
MLRFAPGRLTALHFAALRFAVRRLIVIRERRNHNRRPDAEPVPWQIQTAIAFDEREQMSASQTCLVVLDHEIKDGLAALLRCFASAQFAPLGQILGLGGGLHVEPAVETIEIVLGGNELAPWARWNLP